MTRALLVHRSTPIACLLVVLAGLLLAPPRARADGDPASDALLVQPVFYPYSSPVRRPAQEALNAAIAAARRSGVSIKAALISAPDDLGSITALFGKPQQYAKFLDQEISFQHPQQLLVVMADGYGLAGFSPTVQRALAASPRPAGRTPSDLARAATTIITKLTRLVGHPAVPSSHATASASSSSSSRAILLLVLCFAAFLTVCALIVVRALFPPGRQR
jgi:hypothetical protein